MALQLHHRVVVVIRFQRKVAALGNCSMRLPRAPNFGALPPAYMDPPRLQDI